MVLVPLFAAGIVRAQDQHKRKVPGLDKITSAGSGREAFSGLVQSLDVKDSLLVVRNAGGDTDEYFPFKKNVSVASATGRYLTLAGVKPGASVLIYYEQKGDKRTVKEIVVLENAPVAPKPAASSGAAASSQDKSPPPS